MDALYLSYLKLSQQQEYANQYPDPDRPRPKPLPIAVHSNYHIDMGAQIILCDPHRATVIGHDHQMRLRATRMTSPDIRAGVALLIAAMSAEGTSTIQNIEQIDRGYKDIDGRLNALGARITRVEE